MILFFDSLQGKYINSQPLQHSQKVLKDTDDELRIKLKICITYDFVQELLSYEDRVSVIEPGWLVDTLKKTYQRALDQYP